MRRELTLTAVTLRRVAFPDRLACSVTAEAQCLCVIETLHVAGVPQVDRLKIGRQLSYLKLWGEVWAT